MEDLAHVLGAVVGDYDTDMRLICHEGLAESSLLTLREPRMRGAQEIADLIEPSPQRFVAADQQAAGISLVHTLSLRLPALPQCQNDLLRSVLRELSCGHAFCPAMRDHDYANKRLESTDPSTENATQSRSGTGTWC